MKKKNIFKKYIIKNVVIILSVLLLVASAVAFMFLRENVAKLEVEISQADQQQAETLAVEIAKTEMYKEYALIFLSVFASAFVSAVFIERNNSNKIVEEIFANDVFTSERFWHMFTEDERQKALETLDGLSHFGGNIVKGEMYNAVKRKINSFEGSKSAFYYEEYYLDVSCTITEKYIEKRIIKTAKIRTFDKRKSVPNFVLLSLSSPKSEGYTVAEIATMRLNGSPVDGGNIQMQQSIDCTDKMAEKRGYKCHTTFTYMPVIDFSSKKTQTIEVEYITRCPLNDLVYSCRMPCACKRFDFKFAVNTDGYVLNPVAFGFIDDAKDSPNHTEDRKNVSLRFNDWIFPQDGVCVYLEKSVAN